jgi:hypothetical protein
MEDARAFFIALISSTCTRQLTHWFMRRAKVAAISY